MDGSTIILKHQSKLLKVHITKVKHRYSGSRKKEPCSEPNANELEAVVKTGRQERDDEKRNVCENTCDCSPNETVNTDLRAKNQPEEKSVKNRQERSLES